MDLASLGESPARPVWANAFAARKEAQIAARKARFMNTPSRNIGIGDRREKIMPHFYDDYVNY